MLKATPLSPPRSRLNLSTSSQNAIPPQIIGTLLNDTQVTTLAGNGTQGIGKHSHLIIKGFADGYVLSAKFNNPYGICIDPSGNIFISDQHNNRIRKIDSNGFISTVAGDGTKGFHDGYASAAQFNRPSGIAADHHGNIYVADPLNHRIRKIDAQGMVTTVTGNGIAGCIDGPANIAQFN
jgi:DNA-binding beta-propeller fold protein YncE